MAKAETRLAACWVYLLHVEKAWLAPGGTHIHTPSDLKNKINIHTELVAVTAVLRRKGPNGTQLQRTLRADLQTLAYGWDRNIAKISATTPVTLHCSTIHEIRKKKSTNWENKIIQ